MNKVVRAIVATTVFGLALGAPAANAAATVTPVYTLTEEQGNYINNLVLGKDGNLYGSADSSVGPGSGPAGTIFKLTPAGKLTVTYNFNNLLDLIPLGNEGFILFAKPGRLVAAANGLIYLAVQKTYLLPQTYGAVLMFSPLLPEAVLTLHYFSVSNEYPSGTLIRASDGNLYGITYLGGAVGGPGTIFQINALGAIKTLYQFGFGLAPASLMQATNGILYGTSYSDTVFSMTTAGQFTTLHSFTQAEGQYLYSTLVEGRDGNLYGVSEGGGADGYGTVFRLTPAGAVTVLHNFSASDGRSPLGALILGQDGNFYGGTEGAVYEVSSGSVFSVLCNQGVNLQLQVPDGSFYGIGPSENTVDHVTLQ